MSSFSIWHWLILLSAVLLLMGVVPIAAGPRLPAGSAVRPVHFAPAAPAPAIRFDRPAAGPVAA